VHVGPQQRDYVATGFRHCMYTRWMAEASIGRSAGLRDEIVRVTDLASQAPDEKELMSKQANSLKLSDYTWRKKTGSLLAEMSLY
jgi:hypothetical protein